MKKRSQEIKTESSKPAVNPDDDWNDDDDSGSENEWLEVTVKERDSSRIRRQMEARRKLEQLMEAKRLKNLLDDWEFNDTPAFTQERRR